VKAAAGDFLILVDKPEGPTSHDVVAMARRALNTRRVGHTGTLDRFASGLLVLCVGRATRLAEYLSGQDKRYVAEAHLGVTTDTLDPEGEIQSTTHDLSGVTDVAIREALRELTGDIDQIPPQFSAKKVRGEAMHRKARRGEEVSLPPVRVRVHSLELLSVTLPRVRFEVHCASGTYVRAIARDLGTALGVGAHLTALRRTAVGAFDVRNAVPADRLGDPDAVRHALLEPIDAIAHLPRVDVSPDAASRIGHGQGVPVEQAPTRTVDHQSSGEGPLVAVSCDQDLIAVASFTDGVLRPRKVFAS
jgi:tRNA pseudouridine55 synthase